MKQSEYSLTINFHVVKVFLWDKDQDIFAITIRKAFVRPHLGYGELLYDQAYNASFHQN